MGYRQLMLPEQSRSWLKNFQGCYKYYNDHILDYKYEAKDHLSQ